MENFLNLSTLILYLENSFWETSYKLSRKCPNWSRVWV